MVRKTNGRLRRHEEVTLKALPASTSPLDNHSTKNGQPKQAKRCRSAPSDCSKTAELDAASKPAKQGHDDLGTKTELIWAYIDEIVHDDAKNTDEERVAFAAFVAAVGHERAVSVALFHVWQMIDLGE